ncbi:MAG: hypothetical protein AAFX93_16645 [Verrucomicrobiota bacterium]
MAAATTSALACILALNPQVAEAQKLQHPNGWSQYNWATDNFNDTSIGWQWTDVPPSWINWEQSKRKNGSLTWTRFRTQNIQMTGSALRVINWHHSTPITENGRTFEYSGGWFSSKANWLTEGQFQAHLKVDWNFADIWPTFWTSKGGGDELDIMEYQSGILNHAHHDWGANPKVESKRNWFPWTQPTWHYNWAMERVRSWTHWACRTTRNTQATFYINGKLEHTSNITRVDTPMEMYFTSSPHKNHLPAPGNYPDFHADWVETYIP